MRAIQGALLATLLIATPNAAWAQANCTNTGRFDTWLAQFKKEALAQGISQAAINAASPYLVLEQRIINIDRGQRVFGQTFIEFSTKRVNSRLAAGKNAI